MMDEKLIIRVNKVAAERGDKSAMGILAAHGLDWHPGPKPGGLRIVRDHPDRLDFRIIRYEREKHQTSGTAYAAVKKEGNTDEHE